MTDSQAAELAIWIFRSIVVLFVLIIAWFLKRTANDLDHCETGIRAIRENDLPELRSARDMLNYRMDVAEREIEQLQLRDLVKGEK